MRDPELFRPLQNGAAAISPGTVTRERGLWGERPLGREMECLGQAAELAPGAAHRDGLTRPLLLPGRHGPKPTLPFAHCVNRHETQ